LPIPEQPQASGRIIPMAAQGSRKYSCENIAAGALYAASLRWPSENRLNERGFRL
jgi:hypothetical protein